MTQKRRVRRGEKLQFKGYVIDSYVGRKYLLLSPLISYNLRHTFYSLSNDILNRSEIHLIETILNQWTH